MSLSAAPGKSHSLAATHALPCYVAGKPVGEDAPRLEVRNPYHGEVVGEVLQAQRHDLEAAITAALTGGGGQPLTRSQRYDILMRAHDKLKEDRESFAALICSESGLCMRETRYEVGRALDVLRFSAIEALRDDGQIFSGDVSPQGKARKIFTVREPLRLAAAITPFNHPLNQVAHKVAPAIAAGTPIILKPSDKTPLTAIRFTELLYEAGLPPWMLSVLVGDIAGVIEPLICDERVELVSFTGSVAIGKHISRIAGYKKLCLELGGNSPLIILDDADMELALSLAAEGSYRNSGQRCTAAKRILVHEKIIGEFTRRFVEKSREYTCGDPTDEATRVGTVISEAAAAGLQRVVDDAVTHGARVLLGGKNEGALMPPTVIADVPRHVEMVVCESFGPLAPIMAIKDVDDAIALANGTAYGLSTGVVTQSIDAAIRIIKSVRTGTVNINEIPGYRIESSPFGGVKDSGLGVKEGVIEAMRVMSYVKTFSLPW